MTVFLSLSLCQPTWAQSAENQQMVFEGTLTDTSGNAIDLQSQQLYFYISAFDSFGNKCILFAETSSVAGDSSGSITHRYGSGNAVTSPVNYNHSLVNSVFSGLANGKLADGSGVSCSVALAATRYVDVYSAVLNISGSITLGSSPYAQFANNANTLNGKYDTDFILASSISGGTDGQILSRSGSSGFTWINLPSGGGVSSIDLGSASATGILASARLPDVVSAGTYAKVTVDSKGRVTSSSLLSASDIGSGTFPTTRGGTGMSSIGTANTLLAVNNSATGLEYKAIAGVSGVIVTTGPGAVNVSLDTFGVSGTYVKVTVDSYGRVSGGQSTIAGADIGVSSITYSKLNLTDGDVPQSKINGLSSTLSGKENAISSGTASQYWRGDKTWQTLNTAAVSESTNLYYTDARVRSAPLTGFMAASDTTIVAADTTLQAFAKLQGQLNARWQTMGTNMFFNMGNVAIGNNVFPGAKLYVKHTGDTVSGSPVAVFEQSENSNISDALPALTLSRRLPASAPQNGFGSSLHFNAEDSSHTMLGQATIAARWVNATNGNAYSSLEFVTRDPSGSVTTKLYMDQNAVTIPNGSLVVSGSIRVGSDGGNASTGCGPMDAGKQRYNSMHSTMEYCDGQYWQGVAGVTHCTTVSGGASFTLVGTAGTKSAFCVDTNTNTAATYSTASSTCRGRNVARKSQVKVCSVQQLDAVCESGTALNSFSFTTHWTSNGVSGESDNYTAIYKYASTCHLQFNDAINIGRKLLIEDLSLNYAYRCCYE